MPQRVLSFNYGGAKSKNGMTVLGGLPLLYMDMAHIMGLSRSVAEHIEVRKKNRGTLPYCFF